MTLKELCIFPLDDAKPLRYGRGMKLTQKQSDRLTYTVNKIVTEEATRQELIEAGEIIKIYTKNLPKERI